MKIELLDEVTSTNDYIRRYLGGGEDRIVCARRQTGGRGTKGRVFLSEEGGVYLSALTFYRDFPAAESFRIMAHAAVSVCKAAQELGVACEIKWPNDVYACGRKLCGILIENAVSEGKVVYSIVGIGLNAENDVSALGGIAINLSEAARRPVSAEEARERLIEAYGQPTAFSEYLSYVRFLGREVTVKEKERKYRAVARRILSDGRLEVEYGGGLRALSAAEISLQIGGER